jgi:hypothetical protein
MLDPRLIVAGSFIGFLVGLTGMGGGSLTTPFLIFVLHMRPVLAVGTDLMYAAGTKLVGAATHVRQRTVDPGIAKLLCAGAVPGALAGVATVSLLHAHADAVIKRSLGIALVLVGVSVLARQLFRGRTSTTLMKQRPPLTIGLGAVVGFLVGLTSVGSGTLMMAVLLLAYRILSPNRMVGTDVVLGFVLSAVAGLAHLGAGHVEWRLVLAMWIGSVPGVYLGSKLSSRTPHQVLRPVLAVVLLVSGARMF